MHRRRALEILGSLAVVPALAPRELLALGERVHQTTPDAPRALTPAQMRTVVAAAEQILPRTGTPGATDAGVAPFIDVMLADWYSPGERDRFVAGIDQLDRRATRVHGASFADCAPAQQAALLRDADAEVASSRGTAATQHWFAMLKYLTVWGYCTSRVVGDEGSSMKGTYDGNAPYKPATPS